VIPNLLHLSNSLADLWFRKWLNDEERKVAIERLRNNQTGIKNRLIKWYQAREAALDPKTWLFVLFGLSTQVVNGAVSNFGSLIVKGFGFSSLHTTILQIPYGFIILFSNVSAMYVQRWIPGQTRCIVAICYVLPALAGVVGIHVISRDHRNALLACYYVGDRHTQLHLKTC
jgi:membrane-associated phospholipid phosphatase